MINHLNDELLAAEGEAPPAVHASVGTSPRALTTDADSAAASLDAVATSRTRLQGGQLDLRLSRPLRAFDEDACWDGWLEIVARDVEAESLLRRRE